MAFCPHWRFGQWHTVHCHYVHWHFSIGVLSGYISGIGILGYGVSVIGISAVAFCPDTRADSRIPSLGKVENLLGVCCASQLPLAENKGKKLTIDRGDQ